MDSRLKRKIQKILLIQPPLTVYTDLSSEPKGVHPPLGLAYLAAVLESDYEVRILDSVVEGFDKEEKIGHNMIQYGLSWDDLKKEIGDFSPDLVGISNLFSSGSREALQTAAAAKRVDPEIITVIGGAHPSALPEKILVNDEVDFVILGEGEYSFRELLRSINKQDLTELDGAAFKQDGELKVIPKTRFIEDLDELPLPARHLLPMNKYFEIGEAFIITQEQPFSPVITSRGCTAQCTFCPVHSTWGKKWRARSADSVLSEIEFLIKTYGVREIHFDDDNLVLNRKRAEAIFQGIIDRKLDIVWTVPTGLALWAVDAPLLNLMKESGCYKLYVAVESGDEHILHNVIQKPLDLKKIKPLVQTMKGLGIEVETFFVVGMPGETKESLKRTFSYARGLDVDSTHYFYANPMPGTRLWEICEENGYFRQSFSFEKIRVEKANINTPSLSYRELEKLVSREQLMSRILAVIRHPIKITRKYLSYFKKDRRIVFKFILKNIFLSFKRERED